MNTTTWAIRSGFWASGLLALLGIVSCAGFLGEVAGPNERTVFCHAALAGFERGERFVALQDNGQPGRGDCDGAPTLRDTLVLGLDCKLRDPAGEVVDRLAANGDDGTCVVARSYPSSWTHG